MKLPALFTDRNKWPYHASFILIIIFVVAYKFNDLFLPYFWDELGVYSQSAYYQYMHGLSLVPSSVPTELSHGHPLLFTLCNAIIFKIFGPSILAGHLFNLSVAICLLAVLYISATKYFGSLAAIISCAFLASQPVFLAQSNLILPEIMLSLFALTALICFYEEKYFLFAVFSSLAILTKETAVILPATVIIYSFVQLLYFHEKSSVFKLKNIFFILSPYIVFGGFLLVQKHQNGWYFFPHHIELMPASMNDFALQCKRYIDFIFWGQGRCFWTVAMIAGIIFSIYEKKYRLNSLFLLMIVFIFVFILFSAINFYMNRYAMMALVPLAFITGALISTIIKNKFFTGILTLLLCAASLLYSMPDNFNYDADMGYRKSVTTIQSAVNYVASINAGRKKVYANFPGFYAINLPASGYLKNDKIKAVTNLNDEVDYFIFSTPGEGAPPDSVKYKTTILQTFKDGFAEVKVYRLEKK